MQPQHITQYNNTAPPPLAYCVWRYVVSFLIKKSCSTIPLEFWNRAPFERLRNLNLGLTRGQWRVWSLPRTFDSLKTEIKLLGATDQKIQPAETITLRCCWLWRESEGEKEVFFSPDFTAWLLQIFLKDSMHLHLYCWTINMMIPMIRLQI